MRRFFIFALSFTFALLGASLAIAKESSVNSSEILHKYVGQIFNSKNDQSLRKQFEDPYVVSIVTHLKSKPPIYHSPRHHFSPIPHFKHSVPQNSVPKYVVPSSHPIVNNIQLNSASGSPQQIAASLVPSSQLGCFDSIINRESGWNVHAENPSGAYGLPQALPGSKMASAGPDWQNSAYTQLKWAIGYMDGRYGSPCSAWSHEVSYGWY